MLTPSPQDNKGQRRRTAMRTSATPSEAAGSSPASSVSTSHDLNALIAREPMSAMQNMGTDTVVRWRIGLRPSARS